MAKVSGVTPLENLESQTTAVQAINQNFDLLVDAIENTVSRDGTTPNELTANLDMNGHRLINLPSPQSSSEPARWADISALTLTGYAVPSITGNAGKRLSTDGTSLLWSTGGSGDLLSTNNLSDVVNPGTARTNLGLGTASTANVGTSGSTVPVNNGSNTFSGSNVFTNTNEFSGDLAFSATRFPRLTTDPTALDVNSIGYLGAPQNLQNTNYTFVLSDAGKGVSHSSGSAHTWTIPSNGSVPFPLHTLILLDNTGAGAVTIARGAGVTLRTNGSGTSADGTLSQNYVRSIYKIATDIWVLM